MAPAVLTSHGCRQLCAQPVPHLPAHCPPTGTTQRARRAGVIRLTTYSGRLFLRRTALPSRKFLLRWSHSSGACPSRSSWHSWAPPPWDGHLMGRHTWARSLQYHSLSEGCPLVGETLPRWGNRTTRLPHPRWRGEGCRLRTGRQFPTQGPTPSNSPASRAPQCKPPSGRKWL